MTSDVVTTNHNRYRTGGRIRRFCSLPKYLTLAANTKTVSEIANTEKSAGTEIIEGPRGTRVRFKIRASLELQKSNYLFDKIGGTTTLADKDSANVDIRFIDSTIRVQGATTGNKVEVPVRYVKQSSE